MFSKRILGIIAAILGASLILSSFYIKNRVSEGRGKISEAEDNIQKGKLLFSLNPLTKEIGESLSDSAEIKIKEGSAKADRYETLALWFQIGGGAFVIISAGLIFMGRKKHKII